MFSHVKKIPHLLASLSILAAPSALLVTAPTPPANAQSVAKYSAAYDTQTHNRINAIRKARGARSLTKSSGCLMDFAKARAKRMATNREMVHYPNLVRILKKCGGHWIGENVAMGFVDPRVVCKAWFDSPGHKKNMLNKRYRVGAVATYADRYGKTYTVSLFWAP